MKYDVKSIEVHERIVQEVMIVANKIEVRRAALLSQCVPPKPIPIEVQEELQAIDHAARSLEPVVYWLTRVELLYPKQLI